MRSSVLVCACLVGCGRLDFASLTTTGDGRDGADGLTDAPPLPATLLCSQQTLAIPAVPANTELAITAFESNLGALWIGAGGAVFGVNLDASFHGTIAQIIPGPVDSIAGIDPTPSGQMFVTRTGSTQTLWVANGGAPVAAQLEASVISRAPLMTDLDTNTPRTWTRGTSGGLIASYVNDDGGAGVAQTIATANPVVAVASADNYNHGHIVWAEDLGAGTISCTQGDMLFNAMPQAGGSTVISNDCHAPRMTSGPSGTDSIFTAWATSTGEIDLRYLGNSPNSSGTLSPSGRVPRVEFDGTRFWVAWLDIPTGQLRLAIVDPDLTHRTVDLPGWTPRSDGAFELVRRGNIVYLAILSSDSLSLLETCP